MKQDPVHGVTMPDIRVLELAQVVAGPYCGMMLSDLGCEVIKIEPVERGDALRTSLGGIREEGETSAFSGVNRNKKSVAIDLKSPEGLDFFYRLVRTSDVVTIANRPGVAERLRVDYETLRAINPRLIYGSISGFGETGPWATRGGYDVVAQSVSGVMSLTGLPGHPPMKAGVPVADISAGIYLTVGILAALHNRTLTGEGQFVSTSLFEAGLSLCFEEAMHYWDTGEVSTPQGSAHRFSAPYQAIRASDGYITVAANTDRLWAAMAATLGHSEWAQDERFSSNARRMMNRTALIELIEAITQTYTRNELISMFLDAQVPCGEVFDVAEALESPQAQAREMVIESVDRTGEPVNYVGFPINLSNTPLSIVRPAPALGEHTDSFMTEVGLTPRESAPSDSNVDGP